MNFHVMQGFAESGEMEELGARNNVPTNFTLSVYFQLDPLSEQLDLILDYDASQKYMGLPKDRRIVFGCADGARSLDVASYFLGHGFTHVYALRGGFGAW